MPLARGRPERQWNGWALREAGQASARHSVLLLPGGLCTAAFYDDLLADPRLVAHDVRFVAATPPGFGGQPPPLEIGMESYAHLTAEVVAELGVDVVVGHSYFANVALEMAASGEFDGPIVLLSPCFSAGDEELDLRILERISRVPLVGHVPWLVSRYFLDFAMRGRLPEERRGELVAEMKKSDGGLDRRITREYFDYLGRHGSLVGRLCKSGVAAWVVRGDRDEIGLTEDERTGLEACRSVSMVTVPDAAHFVMLDQPSLITELILEVVGTQASTG